MLSTASLYQNTQDLPGPAFEIHKIKMPDISGIKSRGTVAVVSALGKYILERWISKTQLENKSAGKF